MACKHAALSSDSPSQNLARSLLNFTTDYSPSITKVNCTSMLTESTLKSLGLAWSGDFESLKRFVSESLKLDGVWSQPGRDKKVFTAKDVCIICKVLHHIEGVKANQLKKEVCRLMCDYPSKSLDTSVEFENLKHGQLLNGKAIQELSDTGRHIDAVISQVQDFMKKNKRNSEEKVFQRENLHASFVNEMQCCDANDVDQNKSTNLEHLKTIAIADGDYSLVCSAIKVPCVAEPTGNKQITHNSHITSSFSDDEPTQVKATGRDNTYAEVAARLPPPAKMNQCMVALKDTSPHHKLPANIDDGFTLKEGLQSVLRIGSAHNKGGPPNINIVQISHFSNSF